MTVVFKIFLEAPLRRAMELRVMSQTFDDDADVFRLMPDACYEDPHETGVIITQAVAGAIASTGTDAARCRQSRLPATTAD